MDYNKACEELGKLYLQIIQLQEILEQAKQVIKQKDDQIEALTKASVSGE